MKADQNFKQVIRNYLDDVQLDDQQMQNLNSLQNRLQHKKENTIGRRSVLSWAMAACVLIASLFISMQYFNNKIILSQIAAEIAQNHLRLDKLEFQSDQFGMIAQHFDKLDFIPSLPDNLSDLNQQDLLGARYCSIHGSIALQLRYGQSILDSATLYIASPKSGVKGELKNQLSHYNNRYVTHSNGVNVQLWYEQGLLYAVSQQP